MNTREIIPSFNKDGQRLYAPPDFQSGMNVALEVNKWNQYGGPHSIYGVVFDPNSKRKKETVLELKIETIQDGQKITKSRRYSYHNIRNAWEVTQ